MAEKLLVTWIAPVIPDLDQLAWLNELGRIQKISGVHVLTRTGSDITLDDVATVLREPCDVLVWSGHGAPGGLLLPDHSLVRTKWLAAQVSRGCRPRVVILAACGSQLRDENLRSLTEAICRSGINVIGFPASASDNAADTFVVEYVRALAVNTAVALAFDVALEAIADNATAAGVFLTPGILDMPFDQMARLHDILASLARIEKRLNLRNSGLDSSAANASPPDAAVASGGIHSLARSGHIRGLSQT